VFYLFIFILFYFLMLISQIPLGVTKDGFPLVWLLFPSFSIMRSFGSQAMHSLWDVSGST
jgi:hypothetical protein